MLSNNRLKTLTGSRSMIAGSKMNTNTSTKITGGNTEQENYNLFDSNNFFLEQRAERYRRLSQIVSSKLQDKFEKQKKLMMIEEERKHRMMNMKMEQMNSKASRCKRIKRAISESKQKKMIENMRKQNEKRIRIQKNL